MGAAGWSGKRASQLSFFSPPFALSFGAQYLASMAAAATILCVPERLHHQRVYLLKVSLHNHNHMRSTQLLRLQAYTHIYILIQCNSIISPKIMDQFSIPYTTRVLFFAQFHHLPKLPVLLGVNPPVFRPLRPHKPELQPSSFHQLLLQLMRFLCFKRIRIQ